MVENFDGQTFREGSFSPMNDGATYNGFPVYESDNGQQMWNTLGYGWKIGTNPSSGYGISSSVSSFYFYI